MLDKTAELGSLLARTWQKRDLIPSLDPELLPSDRTEAYVAQDAMIAAIGLQTVGWKVGAVAKAVQVAEGLDGPVPGRLIAPTVFHGDATYPAAETPAAKLECEYAFRFLATPPVRDDGYSAADLSELVTMHVALDITSTRFAPACKAGLRPIEAMRLGIADNGNGGAIVIGDEISGWRELLPLTESDVEIDFNSRTLDVTFRDEWRMVPLDTLVETATALAARGHFFQKGDYLLTGSLTVPQPICAGDKAIIRFEGGGTLSVSLT